MPDNKLAPLQHRPLEEHVRKVALVFNELAGKTVVTAPDPNDVWTLWAGTAAEYTAIATKNAKTAYFVKDTGQIYVGSDLVAEKNAP